MPEQEAVPAALGGVTTLHAKLAHDAPSDRDAIAPARAGGAPARAAAGASIK